jgi:hypothetical protein
LVKAWSFVVREILEAYKFIVGNYLVVKIFQLFAFIKRIWVIGHLIRLVIWSVKSISSSLFSMAMSLLGVKYLFKVMYNILFLTEQEQKMEETGGSLLPKITLSILIVGFKIRRAMKIIKKKNAL